MRIERYMKILCGQKFLDDLLDIQHENIFLSIHEHVKENPEPSLADINEDSGSVPLFNEIESVKSKGSKAPNRDRVLDRFKSKVIEFGTKAEQEESLRRL